MERLAFAIITELRCKDRFGVLGIGCKDEPLSGYEYLNRLRISVWRPIEKPVPELEVVIVADVPKGAKKNLS